MDSQSTVKILVVEDEILLAQDIRLRLTNMGYEVLAIAASVSKAVEYLENLPDIHLVIIDIILQGDQDGIKLAAIINEKYKLPFIFLTSHADSSLVDRAKEVKPYAYMLKPFNDREIAIALEMTLSNFAGNTHQDSFPVKEDSFTPEENQVLHINNSLFLKKNNHFQRVSLQDIAFLEADNNYTTVYTQSEKFIYSTVLRKMEEKLPGRNFLRVHRSYVINIEAVSGFEGNTLFIGDRRVPVSKQYREEVFKIFNTL